MNRLAHDDTETTVSSVAHACGFTNADMLTRSFRAEYSMTPMEFRRRCRTAGTLTGDAPTAADCPGTPSEYQVDLGEPVMCDAG